MKLSLKNLQLFIMAFLMLLVTNFVNGHQKGDKVNCLKAPAPPIIDGNLN